MINLNRKTSLIKYFNQLANSYSAEERKHKYYWNEIIEYCDYFSNSTLNVIEIGCGTGELISQIKGSRKVGIDFSQNMISVAQKRNPSVEYYVMEAENISLTEKFDLIILSNLIGFTLDVQEVFVQVRKLCHPGTKIIVTYYNHLWEPILKFLEKINLRTKYPNQNWLSQSDIKNLLYISEYEVYRESRRMLIPVYIPFISTFLNKYFATLPLVKYFTINNYTFAKPAFFNNNTDIPDRTVSIVIPARNESGNLESGLLRIPKFGKNLEIIFIEGNSTDDTWQMIKFLKENYPGYNIIIGQQSGKGKYDAVKKGFDLATGDILMILDADLTVPPEDLPKFYNAIISGKGDFINGCRLVYPMEKQAMRFLNVIGNKFFSSMFSWLLSQPLKDTLCGTKVLWRKDYINLATNRKFFGDFDPFGDFDLLFGAYKLNLKIVELPIRYQERKYGETNISRFKHGLILLRMCVFAMRKIKFR